MKTIEEERRVWGKCNEAFEDGIRAGREEALEEAVVVVHRYWESMEHLLDCGHGTTMERLEAELKVLAGGKR